MSVVKIYRGLQPRPKRRPWHRQRYDTLEIVVRDTQVAAVYINGVLDK